jgi:hypothetical protein
MRRICALLVVCCAAAAGASAQLEQLFSRHLEIRQPRGDFPPRLIRLQPGTGQGWKTSEDTKNGFKIGVPSAAAVDSTPTGSRVLQVTLGESSSRPNPVFRIDAFEPGKDDPISIDEQYAADYAEEYPDRAFAGKFNVTDSGLLMLAKKGNLAMVGGNHQIGAGRAYRLQCAFLSKERQLFLTFDCAQNDWPRFMDVVGAMLLSFEPPRSKRK